MRWDNPHTLSKGQWEKALVLDFPVSRGLFLYDYWFVRGFSPRYKGLKRLQNGAKKEVTLSAHEGTHILRWGDRRNGNYPVHLPTLCQVLSLLFLAIHSRNTSCTMSWAPRMEQRTNLVVEEKQLKIIAMTIYVP